MTKKTKRTLLVSILALCICTMLIVGGTYALFTDEVKVENNHLDAGTLKVGLYRTSYTQTALNDDGLMEEVTDGEEVNLRENANKIFEISNAVPTSVYKATIQVKNEGDVAFEYGMRILWKASAADEKGQKLAEQIVVTVEAEGIAPITGKLSEFAGDDNDIGELLKGKSAYFTVTAEFVNDEDVSGIKNNDVMNAEVSFDVQVYAAQITRVVTA